jgi:hypothetical protein
MKNCAWPTIDAKYSFVLVVLEVCNVRMGTFLRQVRCHGATEGILFGIWRNNFCVLRDINGRVDVSATGIFHAHRIVVAEGWVVGLGMVQSKVIYRTKRDHRIFKS